jgi:hypothetical protein
LQKPTRQQQCFQVHDRAHVGVIPSPALLPFQAHPARSLHQVDQLQGGLEERTEERREDGTSKPSKRREFKKRSPGERGDQDSRSVAGGCVEVEERGWT